MNKIACISIFLVFILIACVSTVTETPNQTVNMTPTPVAIPTLYIGVDEVTSDPNHLCEKVPEPERIRSANSNNVYLSGRFYLCAYDGSQIAFDFDRGDLGDTKSTNTDIILVISGASIDNRSLYYIRETNNSYVAVSEVSLPTPKYCKQQSTATNRLTLVLSSVGATGCVLTNEGRLAFFQVERLDPFGLESVGISFTTWNKE